MANDGKHRQRIRPTLTEEVEPEVKLPVILDEELDLTEGLDDEADVLSDDEVETVTVPKAAIKVKKDKVTATDRTIKLVQSTPVMYNGLSKVTNAGGGDFFYGEPGCGTDGKRVGSGETVEIDIDGVVELFALSAPRVELKFKQT